MSKLKVKILTESNAPALEDKMREWLNESNKEIRFVSHAVGLHSDGDKYTVLIIYKESEFCLRV